MSLTAEQVRRIVSLHHNDGIFLWESMTADLNAALAEADGPSAKEFSVPEKWHRNGALDANEIVLGFEFAYKEITGEFFLYEMFHALGEPSPAAEGRKK
jgi:hypothetical protein